MQHPWLSEVIDVADREARTRGERYVDDPHLGMALTRVEAGFLEPLVDPLIWRDRIIDTCGINDGMMCAESGDPPDRWSAALHTGRLEIGDRGRDLLPVSASAVADVARAFAEAQQTNTDVGPAQLLVGILQGFDISAGTASSVGLTVARVREVAGLTHSRWVPAGGASPDPVRRPLRTAPLVLLGGGTDDPTAYEHIAELACASRRKDRADLRVRAVFAASAGGTGAGSRRATLRLFESAGIPDRGDTGLDFREDAHRSEVVEALRGADVVLLDGGRPENLYDALWATPAYDALLDAADAGAVVVGSSAGMVILGVGRMTDRLSGDGAFEPIRYFGWLDAICVAHYSAEHDEHLSQVHSAFPEVPLIASPERGAVVVHPPWNHFETSTFGHLGQPGAFVATFGGEVAPIPLVP